MTVKQRCMSRIEPPKERDCMCHRQQSCRNQESPSPLELRLFRHEHQTSDTELQGLVFTLMNQVLLGANLSLLCLLCEAFVKMHDTYVS